MTQTVLILLIAQGVAFLVWAVLSFRAIFQIRAIAAGRTGQTFPGPISFLSAAGNWLRDPAHRLARILWLLSLAGIMAPSVWLATQAPIAQ
jgi:hypothetical protein